ncbi:ECF transporter S component [Paenibacillus sp. F411]|uniref:ECF transporter S component n=1 Tax=unclassified Paenibacillus TaxID=185978 RepID=UPI001AB00336|nr:ECF transporter S component [Paenibacillus sp. F411]MBO2945308.1 ECF transporter S component [Paenibacillus sp. F411]
MQASRKFTTQDIVLMAMLAAVNGVLTMYLSPVNKLLTSLGGPIATSVTTGLYIVYGLLAYYIIRKPGTAAITFMIGGTIQALTGPTYGIPACFTAAACYAVVAEGLFAAFRYKKWSTGVMMLAGGALVPLWFVFAAQMFGYTAWPAGVLAAALAVRIVSGVVLCGLLAKVIGDAVEKTGLLRRFALGMKG